MFSAELQLTFAANLLAALAFAAFAGYCGVRVAKGLMPLERVGGIFLLALVASAAWALANCASALAQAHRLPFAGHEWLPWCQRLLDLVRYACWFGFVLMLLRPAEPNHGLGDLRVSRVLAISALLFSAAVMVGDVLLVNLDLERAHALASLMQAVVGLALLEQLLRNIDEAGRWNAKPLCLGLGIAFAYDVFVFSQAALFRTFDSDALTMRAAIHALGLPLLLVSARRRTDWLGRLHVSRAAVFQSATLLMVGCYLLLVSALGYYIRYSGGEWGRALQLTLTVLALLVLGVLVLSGSLRSRLRVYISKNFFSYRYDYRLEWLRFTGTLASGASPRDIGTTVIRALADLVESPAGALWLRSGSGAALVQAARWNVPDASRFDGLDALTEFMQRSGWIVDLTEWRRAHGAYEGLVLPDWLRDDANAWLIVPLQTSGELMGFVLIAPSRAPFEINWEVRDLLKTAASQASGYLAQVQAAEALLEARKFEAFNKMSAFVVHDLKNIITQLSLMMKNAQRLRDNPEFQQDMLDTVENSLEKMRQLMLQLREGERPHGVSSGVDLEAIARRLAKAASGKGRVLELELQSRIHTRGQEERIERVIGHVVQNALDATPTERRVSLRLDETGSQARVQVVDEGCGMSEEFVQNRLFKPFETTKANGMGIGAYESYQYLQELGGRITVESRLQQGTTVTILLPLFHAGASNQGSVIAAQ
ncbi:MAG: PEP-CTERM system histidine kinase PrsK [Paucibacter sp.]|nr:PEP-CTERM system histidine kinase PrsK [Roseateles sp.]